MEDENNPNGGGGNDGGGNNNNQTEEGLVQPFNVSLNFNTLSPSALSSFDADGLTAVAANSSAADVTLCWQNQFGYVVTSPNGRLLKEMYCYNEKGSLYDNTNNVTMVQNLGSVAISNYSDAASLKALSVSSGSIPNYVGDTEQLPELKQYPLKNQVQVNSGDVIAFQKGNVKGVGKVSGLSKVTKKITFSGYVYCPSSAK